MQSRNAVIGVDVDGVLANFNTGLAKVLNCVACRSVVDPDRVEELITCWNWPTTVGYTKDQERQAFAFAHSSPRFWSDLGAYQGAEQFVAAINRIGAYVYYVTNRPGINAKQQTEHWLRSRLGIANPTVLISEHKGLASRALGLDVYIDDKFENCVDVAITGARVYMPTRDWNTFADNSDVRRVDSLVEVLRAEHIPYDADRIAA
jgi:hypothetical protein